MVGLVQTLDPPQCIVDRDALIVDFLRIANHPGNGSEAPGDPHRAGVGKRWKTALEHARVEFVRLAIYVDEATREVRAHHRVAASHYARDEFVDEAVLRAA